MEPTRHRAGWATATVVGVLLAFAPAVAGVRTLSQRDTDQLYGPVRTLIVEALRGGRLPLWNPHEAMGRPLFAEGIHAVLHPVSLAGALLAPSSVDFLIVAWLATAALGAFLFARGLGASPPAAAGAGLAYALSGYSASMTGNLVFLAGLSTLPWLLAAGRAAGTGARWGAVATGLATACAFFSGDAQVAIVGVLLALLLAADAGGGRGAARAIAGLAAGVLLAAVQWVATAELLPLTFRGFELEPLDRFKWALAPGRALEWIVPGLYRGPLGELPRGASGAWLDTPFAESVYLGVPLLAAAALGAGSLLRSDRPGRRRSGRLLLGGAAVLLWLALGHHLGAVQLLSWVPVWSRFQFAEKLMAPLALVVAALAAVGLDALGVRPLSPRAQRALGAAAVATGALLLLLHAAPDATASVAASLLGDAGPFRRATLTAGLPHLVAGLVALLAIDWLAPNLWRTPALALLVALAPAAALHAGVHFGAPAARRAGSPLRLEADAPAPRIVQQVGSIAPGEGEDYVEMSARVASAFLTPAANVPRRVDTVEIYGAFAPRRITTLAASLGLDWIRAFRRFGLTHFVLAGRQPEDRRAFAAVAVEGGRVVQRDEPRGFEVWAVPHRPWAFFASGAVAAASPEEAHARLLTLLAAGGDDARVVVEAPTPPATAPGRILAFERSAERVTVEAESSGPALLVVQDAWWPGWRATIDGRPASLLAADYVVRAVPWPEGRHRLELTYDPPSMRLGLALSALGATLLVALALLAARRVVGRPPSAPAA